MKPRLTNTQRAHLYRLAQATALIRLAREHGIKPRSPEELAHWWQDVHVIATCPSCRAAGVRVRADLFDKNGYIRPSDADCTEAWRDYLRNEADMRKEKTLIALLRGMVDLLVDESARNPDLAAKLESLLSELPEEKAHAKKRGGPDMKRSVPDIYGEWKARGETDFRLWLREQPLPVLRIVIRAQDLDSTRRTAKWKDTAKLADYIADGLRARLSRGSAFLGRATTD